MGNVAHKVKVFCIILVSISFPAYVLLFFVGNSSTEPVSEMVWLGGQESWKKTYWLSGTDRSLYLEAPLTNASIKICGGLAWDGPCAEPLFFDLSGAGFFFPVEIAVQTSDPMVVIVRINQSDLRGVYILITCLLGILTVGALLFLDLQKMRRGNGSK